MKLASLCSHYPTPPHPLQPPHTTTTTTNHMDKRWLEKKVGKKKTQSLLPPLARLGMKDNPLHYAAKKLSGKKMKTLAPR